MNPNPNMNKENVSIATVNAELTVHALWQYTVARTHVVIEESAKKQRE